MSGLKAEWGASLRVDADFRGRPQLLGGVRALVGEICSQCLEQAEQAPLLVMAVQELAENLVKYSTGSESSLTFDLCMLEDQAVARIRTQNAASAEHLREATALFSRIGSAPDASSLYDEMVAASGERQGSRLGLIRLRAEAGLVISCSVDAERLSIAATRSVLPKVSAGSW